MITKKEINFKYKNNNNNKKIIKMEMKVIIQALIILKIFYKVKELLEESV